MIPCAGHQGHFHVFGKTLGAEGVIAGVGAQGDGDGRRGRSWRRLVRAICRACSSWEASELLLVFSFIGGAGEQLIDAGFERRLEARGR